MKACKETKQISENSLQLLIYTRHISTALENVREHSLPEHTFLSTVVTCHVASEKPTVCERYRAEKANDF